MTILVDMDGVLVDFDGRFIEIWNERNPQLPITNRNQSNNFYIVDDLPEEYRPAGREITKEEGFFRNMQPLPAGVESIKTLLESGKDVMICTAPITSARFCYQEKYDWIIKYLGSDWYDRVIITKDKTLVKGKFLFDDKPKITGREKPMWEQIACKTSYNEAFEGKRMDWNEFTNFCLQNC